ncbi:hypothetical protein LLO_2711 [Legionella longbeachae NSW150]|uniref:Uncharacterized protein n=1 Tax=Legionella longbeachae serogroup 1 (strain NSW150) TaxID=661367 RepID=D3HL22_LEGLN|nr:hypothetical protein LLO_2711 [Legionella longbeachae NSW150]
MDARHKCFDETSLYRSEWTGVLRKRSNQAKEMLKQEALMSHLGNPSQVLVHLLIETVFYPYQATLILQFMIHCTRYDKN